MSDIEFNEDNEPDPTKDMLEDTSQSSIPTEEDGEQPEEADPPPPFDGEDA